MKTLICFLFLSFLIISCNNDDANPTGDVLIRVENVSSFDFKDLIVGENEYGDLDQGDFTEYLPFEIAYHYGYIELQSQGETFILQPIDYVGETPLDPGFYTYQVDILDAMGNQYLDLNFVVD